MVVTKGLHYTRVVVKIDRQASSLTLASTMQWLERQIYPLSGKSLTDDAGNSWVAGMVLTPRFPVGDIPVANTEYVQIESHQPGFGGIWRLQGDGSLVCYPFYPEDGFYQTYEYIMEHGMSRWVWEETL